MIPTGYTYGSRARTYRGISMRSGLETAVAGAVEILAGPRELAASPAVDPVQALLDAFPVASIDGTSATA